MNLKQLENYQTGEGLFENLWQMLASENVPIPEREFKFDPGRNWRFDFAWPNAMLAVEIEGGSWSGGRHVRGSGFEEDCVKYNRAAELGWTVLRFTPGMLYRDPAGLIMLVCEMILRPVQVGGDDGK